MIVRLPWKKEMGKRHGYEDFGRVVTRDAKAMDHAMARMDVYGYPDCPNVSEWLPGMRAPSNIEESLVVSLWGMGISSHQSYSPHGLGWILQNQSGKNEITAHFEANQTLPTMDGQ